MAQQKNKRGKPHEIKVSSSEKTIMLALLGKELYGLQIPQAVEEASNGKRKMQIGTLYPVLHSLERKGFVESRWGEETQEERGGARRRYYKLTAMGIEIIEEERSFQSNLINWQTGTT
jgi:PadR family transcriptional regulator, regulatory protein PadR